MRAEALRGGVPCIVNLPPADQAYSNSDVLGSRHYHGSIEFDDGQTWLAKFRLPNHNEPPLQERNFDRRSEFATYRFLENTAVPAPEAYDYADDGDPENLVGAGYILLEKLAGKPLVWREANEVQKDKFTRQLADIHVELERHPLDKLGRLQLSPKGLPEVGPAFFDYDLDGNLIPFGPFYEVWDYYGPSVHQKIKLMKSKTGEVATSTAEDQERVYWSLLEPLPPNACSPFFLRHVDSRDANFLVDDDYNITGIINWELAISVSKASAFQSPLLFYDLNELYHKGISWSSQDEMRLSRILREKGAAELATLAEDKQHFLVDQLIEADLWEREKFLSLLSGWWMEITAMKTFDWHEWNRRNPDGILDKLGVPGRVLALTDSVRNIGGRQDPRHR
ncbi:hypothetical protein ONZ43_g6252 [Nemania bipapillata]|uniref:Uncharacterized protein n=1 Tax=Nemania bipapillata TaxID=110536 RepID=A0ACC2I2N9_9PEZI|nr:hypothetical protein ONZ43_g6252 [Nemania bipapillata]